MQYHFSLPELGSLVCGALGTPATAAEFRANAIADPFAWYIDDMKMLLEQRSVRITPVTWDQVSFRSDSGEAGDVIFLALCADHGWLLSYDAMSARIRSTCTNPGKEPLPLNPGEKFGSMDAEWRFFRCSLQPAISLAVVPGIEAHWFWSTIWRNRSHYLHSGLAALMTNLFALGTSLFSMIVYNRIIPSNALDSLLVLVSGMLILLVIDYSTRTVRNKYLSVAGVDSDLALADRLFSQVLDLEFKARKGTVGTLASTLKEFEHIREFFASATLVSLIDVPFALIFLLAMWIIGGWMIIPVAVGIVVLLVATIYIQPRLLALARHNFDDGQTKHSVLVESLTGLETLKLLGAGGFMRRRFRAVLERQADISEQTKDLTHFSANLSQTVQQLVQMAVVAVGAWLVKDGQFGYGAIIACTILSGKALGPIAQVAQLLVRLNQIRVSYEALNNLMQEPVEHPKESSFLPRGRLRGEIEFRNVSFSYPGQQSLVLDDVSFSIKAGERVAVLGHVGSGKTTISRLIAGLYTPTSGTILIDGIDIRQIAPSDLRENLGIALQDLWLMSATIERNISLGAVDVSVAAVLEAGKLAGVSDFADRHPEGYQLTLRERGESLSGGQRQAISLARALVRRPPMIVLDEPTSSMDARSELGFLNRLKESGMESTLIIITHRTSLLSMVDRVLILEQGKLAGAGSTEQFMRAQSDRGAAADIARGGMRKATAV